MPGIRKKTPELPRSRDAVSGPDTGGRRIRAAGHAGARGGKRRRGQGVPRGEGELRGERPGGHGGARSGRPHEVLKKGER